MKAEQFGTVSEQVRWSAGWLTTSQANADDVVNRCRHCRHFVPTGLRVSKPQGRCNHLGVATAGGATCRNWEAKP